VDWLHADVDWDVGATPRAVAFDDEVKQLLARAELAAQLGPVMAAAARGAVFDPRLLDQRLWRVVARFAEASLGSRG
jgi:hypothetical protein